MERNQSLVAFLAGIIVALGGALVAQSGGITEARAQTSGGGQQMFAVTGSGTSGQSRDVLFVVDPNSSRLAVYEYKDGALVLTAMRNTEFEFRFQEWSPQGKSQRPSVADMREASEKDDKTGGGKR